MKKLLTTLLSLLLLFSSLTINMTTAESAEPETDETQEILETAAEE